MRKVPNWVRKIEFSHIPRGRFVPLPLSIPDILIYFMSSVSWDFHRELNDASTLVAHLRTSFARLHKKAVNCGVKKSPQPRPTNVDFTKTPPRDFDKLSTEIFSNFLFLANTTARHHRVALENCDHTPSLLVFVKIAQKPPLMRPVGDSHEVEGGEKFFINLKNAQQKDLWSSFGRFDIAAARGKIFTAIHLRMLRFLSINISSGKKWAFCSFVPLFNVNVCAKCNEQSCSDDGNARLMSEFRGRRLKIEIEFLMIQRHWNCLLSKA